MMPLFRTALLLWTTFLLIDGGQSVNVDVSGGSKPGVSINIDKNDKNGKGGSGSAIASTFMNVVSFFGMANF